MSTLILKHSPNVSSIREQLIKNGSLKSNGVIVPRTHSVRELTTSNAKAINSRRQELSFAKVMVTTKQSRKFVASLKLVK
jgi:hypothetical protein